MDNIPAYIRRKHGQEPVTYLHPLLEPYLEKTYGIFVYQEDIMSAAIALGGFTGPEADTLGYAIRKKKSAVLRAQKEKFVTQAAERGVAPNVIDAVFKAFEPFERYGFNKAHATCYGLIAYQTAYLKANYTVEYMTAVLTAFRSNEEKVAAAVAECRRMGIEVLPPDVHTSHLEFTVEGDAIRFGLLAVKNVGQGAIESIIAARDEGGAFRSLTDFCTRIDLRLANRKVLEALAKVGALSAFGHPAQILLGLDDAIAAAPGDPARPDHAARPRCSTWAPPTRRPSSGRCPTATEVPVRERLRWEKELLGLYLSEHPMGEVAEQVGRFVTAYSGDLRDESLDGQRVVVGGIVTGVRTVITKAKATMAIVTLEDLQGTIEVVVFPRLYEQTAGDLARRRDPARRRSGRPQGRGGLAAGRPRRRLGRRGGRRPGGVRAAGRGRRSRRWRRRGPGGPAAHGSGHGHGSAGGAAAGRRSVPASRSASRPGSVRPSRRGAAPGVPAVPFVSPRRAGAAPWRRAGRTPPATDRAGRAGPDLPGDARRGASGPDQDDEPSVPDEARARIVADATRRRPGRRRPGHDPPRPVRRHGRAGPRRRRDGDVQGRAARPARARPGSSSTSRRRAAARPCRWSCAAASPTTRSCSPRSAAGSATASSTCASPAPEPHRRRPAGAGARLGAAAQR